MPPRCLWALLLVLLPCVTFGGGVRDRLRDFESWFTRSGGRWGHSVRPEVAWTSCYSPDASWSEEARALSSYRVVTLSRVPKETCDPHELLALRLLEEKGKGGSSRWAQYITLLPEHPQTAVSLSPEDTEVLAGTYAGVVASGVRRRFVRFAHRIKATPNAPAYSDAALAWAMGIVISRALVVGAPRGASAFVSSASAASTPSTSSFNASHAHLYDTPFLAPGADLLNHSPQARVGWTLSSRGASDTRQLTASPGAAGNGVILASTPGAGAGAGSGAGAAPLPQPPTPVFAVVALETYPHGGMEVFNSYHDAAGNAHLLSHHGFTLPDNAFDAVALHFTSPSHSSGSSSSSSSNGGGWHGILTRALEDAKGEVSVALRDLRDAGSLSEGEMAAAAAVGIGGAAAAASGFGGGGSSSSFPSSSSSSSSFIPNVTVVLHAGGGGHPPRALLNLARLAVISSGVSSSLQQQGGGDSGPSSPSSSSSSAFSVDLNRVQGELKNWARNALLTFITSHATTTTTTTVSGGIVSVGVDGSQHGSIGGGGEGVLSPATTATTGAPPPPPPPPPPQQWLDAGSFLAAPLTVSPITDAAAHRLLLHSVASLRAQYTRTSGGGEDESTLAALRQEVGGLEESCREAGAGSLSGGGGGGGSGSGGARRRSSSSSSSAAAASAARFNPVGAVGGAGSFGLSSSLPPTTTSDSDTTNPSSPSSPPSSTPTRTPPTPKPTPGRLSRAKTAALAASLALPTLHRRISALSCRVSERRVLAQLMTHLAGAYSSIVERGGGGGGGHSSTPVGMQGPEQDAMLLGGDWAVGAKEALELALAFADGAIHEGGEGEVDEEDHGKLLTVGGGGGAIGGKSATYPTTSEEGKGKGKERKEEVVEAEEEGSRRSGAHGHLRAEKEGGEGEGEVAP